ncbi:MAG: co-chaperone GroES [Paludibacteraceae bacterium]|nr:co-chaperone GroES [Paludibacteraceae bacterium]
MIKPMGTNVVVKVDKNETVTKGGIILPGFNEEPKDTGTVIRVSINKPSQLKEGDRVLFARDSGQDFVTPDCEEGYRYILIAERNIFATIIDE